MRWARNLIFFFTKLNKIENKMDLSLLACISCSFSDRRVLVFQYFFKKQIALSFHDEEQTIQKTPIPKSNKTQKSTKASKINKLWRTKAPGWYNLHGYRLSLSLFMRQLVLDSWVTLVILFSQSTIATDRLVVLV